jgi:hypothetical protein
MGSTPHEQRLVSRAKSDPQFRDKLITDPKAAAAEEFGSELSDEELAQVAAGFDLSPVYEDGQRPPK